MNLSNRLSHSASDHRSGRNGTVPIVALRDPSPPSNLIGSELSSADLMALEARWLNRELAETAFLRRVDSFTGAQFVGRKEGDYSGIAIPYFSPGAHVVREYRLRRDHPDFEAGANCELRVKQKYLSPPGRGNMLYLPPACDPALLRNVALPLLLTEGEFKTLALWRLATANVTDGLRFLPVGIAGVFNWRGTIAKATGPDGQRLNVKGPIADLDWIEWKDRKVIIAFDARAGTKEQVRYGRAELAQYLRRQGAVVGFYDGSSLRAKVWMITLLPLDRKSYWVRSRVSRLQASIGVMS